jgi:Protein of unknown function (DUF1194)
VRFPPNSGYRGAAHTRIEDFRRRAALLVLGNHELGRWGRIRLVIFGFTALATLLLEAPPAESAALALVLAIDVSASVTAESYLLQHNGIAQAFDNPRLVDAISALPSGIEVLVLEWSDPDKVVITVGWTQVIDAASAAVFAAAVRRSKRSSDGLTPTPIPAGHRRWRATGCWPQVLRSTGSRF